MMTMATKRSALCQIYYSLRAIITGIAKLQRKPKTLQVRAQAQGVELQLLPNQQTKKEEAKYPPHLSRDQVSKN